jgi:hypothetical protein
VEPRFSPFGDSAKIDENRCIVYAERTIGSAIILDSPDGLLGDVGHGKSYFSPFGNGVSVGAR